MWFEHAQTKTFLAAQYFSNMNNGNIQAVAVILHEHWPIFCSVENSFI